MRSDTAFGPGELRSVAARLRPALGLPQGLGLLAGLLLWLRLINTLRVDWSVKPQYTYGYAVPFLCLYLLWHRLRGVNPAAGDTGKGRAGFWSMFLLAALALGYAPVRLVQEASPEWRVVTWAHALGVVLLTLLLVRWAFGGRIMRQAAFAICFFLVSVPWLRPVEDLVIQNLTRGNTLFVVLLLDLLGIPAIQHGNVIEVGTGVVGIDDACSGIRSFQAALMLALFFGELYRLATLPRVGLCLLGFGLSFVFNIARTTLLTWVAARQGVEAIARWHDPAGVTILLGCFLSLWGAAWWARRAAARSEDGSLRREDRTAESPAADTVADATPKTLQDRPGAKLEGQETEGAAPSHSSSKVFGPRPMVVPSLLASSAGPLALLCWVLAVEVGVEAWYRAHERGRPASANWKAHPPQELEPVQRLPIAETTREILRCNVGEKWAWTEADGSSWLMMFFTWEPGRTWVKQVTRHPPESCLGASGWEVLANPGSVSVPLGPLTLAFETYEFDAGGKRAHVFYCLWEDGAPEPPKLSQNVVQLDRVRSALEGRRNPGMKVLELATWGQGSLADAEAALRRLLPSIITVESSGGEPPTTDRPETVR